jgi:hypothetical protein
MPTIDQFIVLYLMYFLVPLWLAAGFADWLCHWHARIEHSTGARESAIHLAMLVEMGIPALAALFLEINALVLVVGVVAFALHEITALWDVGYASAHRSIAPFEQHVHSFLELIPLMGLSCMAFLHRDQVVALFDPAANADWQLRMKSEPLPAEYIATVLVAIALLQVMPYFQELWRGIRASKTQVDHAPVT